MSKEKDLLKEILANTKAIMSHLKISQAASPEKKSDKTSSTAKLPAKKAPVKKASK